MARNSVQDMTKGSPMKLLIQFSLPMLVGNIFQQFYNMADAVVVGRFVSKDALAAVGLTGPLNFFILALNIGLGAGASIVVSQNFGAKDYDNIKKGFATAAYMVFGAAAITGIIGILSSRFILDLLGTPHTIIDQSDLYMKICFAGILGVAGYNGMSAMLRALGDSITPLIFLMVATVLNVLLDLLFVIVFHMGVAGVAIATIISQAVSASGCIIYTLKKVKLLHMPLHEFKPDKAIFLKCIKLGLPVAIQNSFISISTMSLQRVINGFGENVIAACTAANKIELMILQPGMSLGAALTAFTGQNIGANQVARAKKGFYEATKIIIIFSLIMLPAIYFGGGGIVKLFTKDADIDVVRIGAESMRVTCFFYVFVGMIFVSRNFLSGAGDIRIPMLMGFTEVVMRILVSSLLSWRIGYRGIFWATSLTWFITSLVGYFRYFSGKWKDKSVVR